MYQNYKKIHKISIESRFITAAGGRNMFIKGQIFKKILLNGLTILVDPVATLPKVSIELLYKVGSREEESGEKGLAHLIEHMIFKGTQRLSESDINVITHKLSGYTNAFTSHDATSYVFSFPAWNWKEGLVMLSDCMQNARFDEQMLNSELKAVIQELKMYNDRYAGILVDQMLSLMFHDHPYHYPIIGFKQDLWNLNRDTLYNFYKKHYVPNNAILVVVGAVDPEDVFKEAEKLFGSIPASPTYSKKEHYHGKDLISKNVTLYRDVKHSICILGTLLPGAVEGKQYVYDVLCSVLAGGKSSRLVKRLVDELQLVSEIDTFCYDLMDGSPFFIYMEPYDIDSLDRIKSIIHEEIEKIIQEGVTQEEIKSASHKVKVNIAALLESYNKRASAIAKGYMESEDEYHIFKYADYPTENLSAEIQETLVKYFSPSMMHQGLVLPMNESDKERWLDLQTLSDKEDSRILDGRDRYTEVEGPRAAYDLTVNEPSPFNFIKSQQATLSNGIKFFYHNNTSLPTVSIIVSFKARIEYDSERLPGLYTFMTEMLLEGSKNYPGTTIAQEFEKYGMMLSLEPGYWVLTLLQEDLPKGLELLNELLHNVEFDAAAIEKVRSQMITELKMFWDDPMSFAGQLIVDEIYKGHPYSKNAHGTFESLETITADDLKEFYKKVITSDGARIGAVGDFSSYNVCQLFESTIGTFKGESIVPVIYPALQKFVPQTITHPINRDQIVLAYVRPSITRLDHRYELFLIFEQIFAGSSMSSRLFDLRERTGLFYTIHGSLTAHADEQPGMFIVKTIVSKNQLEEAERMIKNTIDTVVDTLTEEDLHDAKEVVINAQINNFSSNKRIAATFLSLDRYNFPPDYFDTLAQRINGITLDQVKSVVKELLQTKEMTTFKVGRV